MYIQNNNNNNNNKYLIIAICHNNFVVVLISLRIGNDKQKKEKNLHFYKFYYGHEADFKICINMTKNTLSETYFMTSTKIPYFCTLRQKFEY